MSTQNNKPVVKKDVSKEVLTRIETFQKSGELRIPEDYSPENALKSAYLILSETKNKQGQSALDHCTKQSIADSLLKMVVWGLSPLKKQCDFIMYADKLDCSIEYTGNIVLAKRYGGLKDIKAHAIFKGDEFDYEIDPETGRTNIIKHKPSLDSIGSKDVVGAYAIMIMKDDTKDAEVMSISMIHAAWNQGAMKGGSTAHKNFPDQMAKKTVINRACKLLIRSSDDSVLYNDNEKYIDVTSEEVDYEVEQNANQEELPENKERPEPKQQTKDDKPETDNTTEPPKKEETKAQPQKEMFAEKQKPKPAF